MADAKEGTSNCGGGPSQSKLILAKPRLAGIGNAFGASSTNASSSQIATNVQPAQFNLGNNPFGKIQTEDDNEESTPSSSSEFTKEKNEAPKFVPLRFSNVTTPRVSVPASNQVAGTSMFVFGQNLSDRVVVEKSMNNGVASTSEHSATNGSVLLFTTAAASVKENSQNQETGSSAESLAAAAAEYERSHARPPPPTTNCTLTGEEDEINILQISCRLFAWESGSWQERGRGVLRLNDPVSSRSEVAGPRLVVRVAGSLRVLLNTKLWPGMVVEQASGKSLRVTATDAEHQIKLFLIMGLPKDIYDLHNALEARIMNIKRKANSNEVETKRPSLRLEQPAEHCGLENGDDDFSNDIDSYNEESSDEAIDQVEDDLQNDEEGRLKNNTDGSVENESIENVSNEGKECKQLKRKEPMTEEVSPKKQCPEQVDGI